MTAGDSTPVEWLPMVTDDAGPLYPFPAPQVGDRIAVTNITDPDGLRPDFYVYVTAVTEHPDGAGYAITIGTAPPPAPV